MPSDGAGVARPLLIGMNNPLSTRPGHELYPYPPGCTGHRLYSMLEARTGARRGQYLEAFERRNLVIGAKFDRREANNRASDMVEELEGSGRTIVLLGNSVREAFNRALEGQLPPLLVHPTTVGGCVWRQIPHPSGLNRWYNEPEHVKVVELLMEELYVEYARKTATMEKTQ